MKDATGNASDAMIFFPNTKFTANYKTLQLPLVLSTPPASYEPVLHSEKKQNNWFSNSTNTDLLQDLFIFYSIFLIWEVWPGN